MNMKMIVMTVVIFFCNGINRPHWGEINSDAALSVAPLRK